MFNARLQVTNKILPDSQRPHLELLTLFLLFTVARLPWLFMVPMAEAPDEFAHYWVVHFLCQYLRLPVQADIVAGGAAAVYGSLPQIGYLPHVSLSVLSAIIPSWDLSVTARLASFLMGGVLLFCAYQMGRELHPRTRAAALSLPLLVIFHPQLVLLHSYINNDSTAVALSSLILLICVRMIKYGVTLKQCLLIGLFCGLLLLCKYSGVAIVFGALFGVSAASFLAGGSIMAIFASCGTILSLMALVASWWFVREWYQFPGDLLGIQTMRTLWAKTYGRPLVYHENVWHIIKSSAWWQMLFFSFWGLFGYMTRYLWHPFYTIYLIFCSSAIAGGALFFYRYALRLLKLTLLRLRRGNSEDLTESDNQQLREIAVYCMFAICIGISLAAMIWSSSQNLGGAQGRYLFPCELAIIAFLVAGIMCLPRKVAEKTLWSLVAFNAVVFVWSSITLFQTYGGFRMKTF
jgi:hypothetical protein